MPPRSVRLRLDDIVEAITEIQSLLAGVSFEQFARIWHLQRATERGLEIISEATRSIPDDLKTQSGSIPWRDIADLGNLLRHEYQRVEPLIIWNIVERHLGELKQAIVRLRQSWPDEGA